MAKTDYLTEIKEYLLLRKELLTIEAATKATRFAAAVILILTGIISAMGVVLLLTIAGAYALEPYTGKPLALIIGAVAYILVWVAVYLLRRTLILNRLARFIYKVLKN